MVAATLEQRVRFEMRLLIAQHDLLDQQIASADAKSGATAARRGVAQRLLLIPGVGPSTAATLMAEIGDILRFTDVDQLLAYAGVHSQGAELTEVGANPETLSSLPRAWAPSAGDRRDRRVCARRRLVAAGCRSPGTRPRSSAGCRT